MIRIRITDDFDGRTYQIDTSSEQLARDWLWQQLQDIAPGSRPGGVYYPRIEVFNIMKEPGHG